MTALRPLNGLVVIDEIQWRPDFLSVLRVLADQRKTPARFHILGSTSGNLMRQTLESLAGRMERMVKGFIIGQLLKTEPHDEVSFS